MGVFSNVILQEVFQLLTGNSTLMGMVGNRIYDDVPQTDGYPYVVLGELDETEANTDDAAQMGLASLTIHTYSRQPGRKETNDIQKEIVNTLHRAAVSVSGFNFVSIDHEQTQSFKDADGKTRHGITEFNFIITEV
ncbi:MAG: DUF3168 domain-containing protein [Nitrospinaceae bacterium]|nr:DUF3168 domain-containing protein [Nitrospinaceae bacterium]NIR55609.1 DUF3168 domain-containing protein [Nitrospinaceae bacterium]NIS86043.1 DUF3168 domain-containing protein [Nitrospinaceae bacterium]NIT82886.1 DUF3168 domain-containing protein [Nitrospinaceae bacterium]NIU45091.1 DUF3168 domain-containing protein [Nitrospinaceae bacterium]